MTKLSARFALAKFSFDIVAFMKNILIIGAGKSATSLIDYLLVHALDSNWNITIADINLSLAKQKSNSHPNAFPISLNTENISELTDVIAKNDVVVSLAPPDHHIGIARVCLSLCKSLFTASYVSEEMAAMHLEVEQNGLLFLNEMGCDPGIDHMSAMEIFDRLKQNGAEIEEFYSYTGGLISKKSDDNPWHYKFSWNPRNVILAGAGTPATYLENNQVKFVPYQRLFSKPTKINILNFGILESYPNRDSLSYIKTYGLDNIQTLQRATFRYPDYILGWHVLVILGLTNDTVHLNLDGKMTNEQFLNSFLPSSTDTRTSLSDFLISNHFSEVEIVTLLNQFEFLGLFEADILPITNATPAQIMQYLMEPKLKLQETDKDLVVMHHEITYKLNNKKQILKSTLLFEGEDQIHTAMAKMVGLPLAISLKMYLNGDITLKGVQIPIDPQIYKPVLKELENFGMIFNESII